MPEPISPEPITDEEALRRLREFLSHLEQLLLVVATKSPEIIPGRHQEAMLAAWKTVQPKFAAARSKLEFKAATGIISRLREAGLLGDELVFKLSIFNHAHDEFRDARMKAEVQLADQPWWKRWFKRAMKAGDVILGSLAKVLPPLEAVKEYKESIEAGMELGEEL